MAKAALATGLKSGITSVGKPRRPGKKKAWAGMMICGFANLVASPKFSIFARISSPLASLTS